MDWMKWIHPSTASKATESFTTGDDVRVWFKIREQDKERLTHFEGVVIRARGSGASKTITVRRITHGEGVERVFPLDAPLVERIEILRHGKVRRSRIYFLRQAIRRVRLETLEGRTGTPETKEIKKQVSSQPASTTSDQTPSASSG